MVLLPSLHLLATLPCTDHLHSSATQLGGNLRNAAAQDTKAATEMSALKAWYSMLANDSARAFYGPGHVFAAHELGAIQTLLLSDSLFRVNDVAKARRVLRVCLVPLWLAPW